MLYQAVQLVYWLALSTWFGSVLFVLISAPVVLRTVRENNPILSDVLSVNLDGQHGTLLAGSIITNLIGRLARVELACGLGLLVALVVQPFVIDLSHDNVGVAAVRGVLYLGAVAVSFYDWQHIWPRVKASRAEYVEHADEPDVANPALDRFDAAQRLNLQLMYAVGVLLLGMVLFSVSIGPRAVYVQASSWH
jgi:hypothetical protein